MLECYEFYIDNLTKRDFLAGFILGIGSFQKKSAVYFWNWLLTERIRAI